MLYRIKWTENGRDWGKVFGKAGGYKHVKEILINWCNDNNFVFKSLDILYQLEYYDFSIGVEAQFKTIYTSDDYNTVKRNAINWCNENKYLFEDIYLTNEVKND